MRKSNAADARGSLSRLVDEAQKQGKVFAITRHGKPAAVLMSYEELESIRKANRIVSDREFVEGMRQSIRAIHREKSRVYSLEELSRRH